VQWKHQFMLWSNLQESNISLFTSGHPDEIDGTALTISTYSMISHSGPRGQQAQTSMQKISRREWGLLVLDEVHVVPATLFRQVLSLVPAHCKLGLTATLVREDDKIGELNYLIGPKLYEANWLDLQRAGHLASVQCCEVWCPMTPLFYSEYLRTSDAAKHQMLYAMNPVKMQSCQRLIEYHEKENDKILVFSDNVFALKEYAARLGGRPCIYGKTPEEQRTLIIQEFKTKPDCKCIFISKVGDTSIDLPEATVIIQISSHYGSRRQEAQRLGRILRPKRGSEPGHTHAYFYSLVSQDTSEMYYCAKRQRFLVDQGYSFKVLREIPPINSEKLVCTTLKDQEDLLQKVINYKDSFKEELPYKDPSKSKKVQKSVTDRITARLKQLPKNF